MELVPTVAELPAGYAAVEGAAGPVDAATVADLDPDPVAASAALRANGFRDGYSAEYSHPDDGSFVSVLVSRYADGPSAKTDFARLVGATRPPARVERIETIGDESHASREAVVEGDVAEIVSVRFRVRDLVWLVEVGGQPRADDTLAKNIAKALVRRTL